MTNRIVFDPKIIDHTNEELMRHYFTRFAADAGITRRHAERKFRDKWDSMKRKLSNDRAHTYKVLKEHL